MFLCEILTEQQQAPPQAVVNKASIKQPVVQQVIPQTQQIQLPAAYPTQQSYNQDQQDDYDIDYDSELDSEDEGGEVDTSPPFPEILPLKKYYLIQRLKNLKSRLDECNINNSDLDIILKFVNNISYNSLVSLFINILPVVEEQLARLSTNEAL